MANTSPFKGQNWINKILIFLVIICLGTMVVLVFLNAVLRYGFNSSIPESEELSRYLFVWVVFLGAILAFKDGQHISIELLVKRLTGRTRLVMDVVRDIFILFAFAIMIVGGVKYMKVLGTTTGASTGIPLACVSVSVVVCAVAMAAIVLTKLLRKLNQGNPD